MIKLACILVQDILARLPSYECCFPPIRSIKDAASHSQLLFYPIAFNEA